MFSFSAYRLLIKFRAKKSLSIAQVEKYGDYALDVLLDAGYVEANFVVVDIKLYDNLSDYYITDTGKVFLNSLLLKPVKILFTNGWALFFALLTAFLIYFFGWN